MIFAVILILVAVSLLITAGVVAYELIAKLNNIVEDNNNEVK